MKVIVEDFEVKLESDKLLVADNSCIVADFEITGDIWSGIITARFYNETQDVFKDVILENNSCIIPKEALVEGVLHIGIYTDKASSKRSRGIYVRCSIKSNGVEASITEDLYCQIIKRLNSLEVPTVSQEDIEKAVREYLEENPVSMEGYASETYVAEYVSNALAEITKGLDGLSAYEIAVKNGYTGTEVEWLESLKGKDGTDGLNGTDGIDGLSAYEVAVKNGCTGTETEWLESLKGEDGKDGADGTNGVDGKDGADGFSPTVDISKNGKVTTLIITDKEGEHKATINDGADGTGSGSGSGADGLSAYEIAVKNGYTGTEAEWLESLKGKDGTDGVNGADGIDGLSAYEVAVENGYTGTETEWLESLKGEDGKDGINGVDGIDGKDGADGTNGVDGKDGADGADGFSPVVDISKSGKVTTITITDKEGEHKAIINDGEDGADGSSSGGTITDTSPVYDTSGFSKSSVELAADMGIGYNIGDCLESFNARSWAYTHPDTVLDSVTYNETLFGNVPISESYIQYLKDIGIGAIRLPITYLEFVDENNYQIDRRLLDRIEELVTSITSKGMYCIINVHHDGIASSSLKRIVLEDGYMLSSTAYVNNIWEQVAERFKNYGYRLIFECFNEVCNSAKNMTATPTKNLLAVQLNQSIIETVRATGGNNANRFIGCPAYGGVAFLDDAAIATITDTATDKLLMCRHEYPSGTTSSVNRMNELKNAGIGSYIGEIGWTPLNDDVLSSIQNLRTVADANQLAYFWWDNGARDYSITNRLYCSSSWHAGLEAYLGKTLTVPNYSYDEIKTLKEPYVAKFYNPDYVSGYGNKYVVITSSKPIETVVAASTTNTSVGYYVITGVENGTITTYMSDDDVTYFRTISRMATKFSQIRDEFHVLGSGENTVLLDSNYTIATVPIPTITVECTGITIDATELTFTSNTAQTLTATITPSDCTQTVTWTSSDENIATVSESVSTVSDGLITPSVTITPVANGSCTITATCGSFMAECTINVSIEESLANTYQINFSGKDTAAAPITIIETADEFVQSCLGNKISISGIINIHAAKNDGAAYTEEDVGLLAAQNIPGISESKSWSKPCTLESMTINEDGSVDCTYSVSKNSLDLTDSLPSSAYFIYTRIRYSTYTVTGTLTLTKL